MLFYIELLGVLDVVANVCWDSIFVNEVFVELKVCLEFVCSHCYDCMNKDCGVDGCGGMCGMCFDGL